MTSPSFIFSAMKVIAQRIKGAFHSTKPFEYLETEANGTEIFKKSFQKFRKLLNFPNANHSKRKFCLEIPREKMNGKKASGKKSWVYLATLSSFLEVLKNAVLFATGKCRKFQQADVLFEWKAPKVSLRKSFFGHYVFS